MNINLIEGINKMYLVNHSKKEYVYLKKYYELNKDVKHNRCMHPLALLASIGNDENSGGVITLYGLQMKKTQNW